MAIESFVRELQKINKSPGAAGNQEISAPSLRALAEAYSSGSGSDMASSVLNAASAHLLFSTMYPGDVGRFEEAVLALGKSGAPDFVVQNNAFFGSLSKANVALEEATKSSDPAQASLRRSFVFQAQALLTDALATGKRIPNLCQEAFESLPGMELKLVNVSGEVLSGIEASLKKLGAEGAGLAPLINDLRKMMAG
jgi:hypothetical protein